MSKPWVDENRRAVVAAYDSGKKIQFKGFESSEWQDIDCPGFYWSHTDYRVKPEEELPKTSDLDEIPWAAINARFQWAFRLPCGSVWVSDREPEIITMSFSTMGSAQRIDTILNVKRGSCSWAKSKQERPIAEPVKEEQGRAAESERLRTEVERLKSKLDTLSASCSAFKSSIERMEASLNEARSGSFLDRVFTGAVSFADGGPVVGVPSKLFERLPAPSPFVINDGVVCANAGHDYAIPKSIPLNSIA